MTAIERIKARLSAHPEIKYSEGPNEIDVKPSENSGFSVGFRITPTGFTVNFEGWHEEFTSEEEALDCFAFLRRTPGRCGPRSQLPLARFLVRPS
jgi:hypothetical protein